MAKLKDDEIGQADLIEYLKTTSDFAFELRCLARLTGLGFQCQHGGSYIDPVTKKTRQFDIRAQKSREKLRVRCAVECKSLSESFPLLVMCIRRPAAESFHELILSYHPDSVEYPWSPIPAYDEKWMTGHVKAPHSVYAVDAFVGKSCAQVGKAQHDDSIIANDAEVFEKWSQALASAADLVDDATEEGEQQNDVVCSLILPILVVPDGMLWQTNYESNGTRIGPPVRTDRCSFFVGQYYSTGFLQGSSLTISHLEFATLSGLETLLKDILVPNNSWFPMRELS